MKHFIGRYYIIFILIALFLAPGMAAIYVYRHPDCLSQKHTNQGLLLHPAVLLTELQASSQWHLLYWEPQGCDNLCIQSLMKLAKIRLALGRKLYQVKLNFIQTGNLSETLLKQIQDMGFEITLLSTQSAQKLPKNGNKPLLFIADKQNRAILQYDIDAPPQSLFHDLNQLLQGSST